MTANPSKNVVLSRELRAAGVSSRTIRSGLDCCLIRLTHGVFSIVARCQEPDHAAIARFITDYDWIEVHRQTSAGDLSRDPIHQETLHRLRITHYLNYRTEDVLWSTSAALMQGIPLYPMPGPRIEVMHPDATSRSPIIRRISRPLDDVDTVSVGGLMMTQPIRTAADLVSTLGIAEGHAALEYALRRVVLDKLGLWPFRALRTYPANTSAMGELVISDLIEPTIARMSVGQARASALLPYLTPFSESYPESRCSWNLHMLGLHDVDLQVALSDEQGFIARVDLLHRKSMTIIFVDGVGKYVDGGFATMRREMAQRNRLLALGYRIIHITFHDLLSLASFADRLFAQAPDLRRFRTTIPAAPLGA